MAMHKFKLGDLVELVQWSQLYAAPGPYEIVRLLPESHGEPQYRIKSKLEDHQRVVNESNLQQRVVT